MTTGTIELHGTLQEDGTLVLDEKPVLPPGRVRVTVQSVVDYKQTDIWQFFEQLWARQRARGHVPRSKEEIDAELQAARQEDEERMQQLERIHEECQQHRRRDNIRTTNDSDALQLAAAVEHGASIFLTADAQLGSFTDLSVEVLS